MTYKMLKERHPLIKKLNKTQSIKFVNNFISKSKLSRYFLKLHSNTLVIHITYDNKFWPSETQSNIFKQRLNFNL